MNSTATTKRKFSPDRQSNLMLYDLLATGLVPEPLVRAGIKNMLGKKLQELHEDDPQQQLENTRAFKEELEKLPIAIETDTANNQHYEVPTEFFLNILGPSMKYSCCLFENATTLAEAEEAMLDITMQRAELLNGQSILDLGCGWGSFTLYAAARLPDSQITAVSNSATQRQFIEGRAKERGLKNIEVITADIKDLELQRTFDRIVSVEMFEHAKNYRRLFAKVANWLKPDGKMFVHVFTHKTYQYHFAEEEHDWLGRYFFAGGTMPSDLLFSLFNDDIIVRKHWRVNGKHYQKTAEAWLQNMTRNKTIVKEIIKNTYGADQGTRWWVYWRLFFLACAELWGYDDGNQWIVSHYLFERRQSHIKS